MGSISQWSANFSVFPFCSIFTFFDSFIFVRSLHFHVFRDFSFLRVGILLASIPSCLLKTVKTKNRRE